MHQKLELSDNTDKSQSLYHQDFHGYNSRSKFKIRKTDAKRKWDHWTLINFACNDWNDLNHDTQEAGDIATFKKLIKGRRASSFSITLAC